ncbi:efflux transporter outer membrane subunit [Sphingobium nicotianae]|uniref:Efflux transporter outer membrane subunit n=1 Tax=Sphingobium nicotianae TaxID=2782607 RepID=A0A9X1DGA9_9SPHN|nr:efflux transporter outer membrane subunit [Sphingobium nicotianae]MBT2189455.1 efflux transporter outer membrane subunit [Sphingobium nicotianae]
MPRNRLTLLPLLLPLGACSMAPAYAPPQVAALPAYKEAPDGWTQAVPDDASDRGKWWAMFNDPVLDDLEARMEKASPDLAASVARLDAALAAARESRADLFPTASASGDVIRARASARRPGATVANTYTDVTVGGALAYEIDLWGRVRNAVRASKAEAQASASDLTNVRLSLQAALAGAYFQLRELDSQAALLRQTVDANSRALDLTTTRHDGGIASGLDVNRAQTVLSAARAQISDVARQRAITEHAIATLIGEVASSFSIAPVDGLAAAPAIAPQKPSTLLQRRPDIAAAERRMFAANARIGVARAAFFPTVSLGASGGWEATGGALFSTPASFWGLGPLSTVLDLFDGGRRAARVKMTRAQYDEMAADYRKTVLVAFRDVEDALAASTHLAIQSKDSDNAAAAAQRTLDLALTRYHDGASDYLEVVVAQTSSLDAQRAAIAVRAAQLQAAIDIVRALGG